MGLNRTRLHPQSPVLTLRMTRVADAVLDPIVLVALHVYTPLSFSTVELKIRVFVTSIHILPPSPVKLPVPSASPLWSHTTVGIGSPLTPHVKVALAPAGVETSMGGDDIEATTAQSGENWMLSTARCLPHP